MTFIEKVHQAIDKIPYKEVEKVVEYLVDTYKNGGTIYTFGNGGSYALAQHLTADLRKLRLKIFCIPSSIAELTMYANDDGYERIFFSPLWLHLQKQDIVIAFSSSGSSKNIIRAVQYAKVQGCRIVGFSGFDKENQLNQLSTAKIHIPTEVGEYGVVESVHDVVLHLLTEKTKHALFTMHE